MVKKRQPDLDVGHSGKTNLVSLGSKSSKGASRRGTSLFDLVEKNRLSKRNEKLASAKSPDVSSVATRSYNQDVSAPIQKSSNIQGDSDRKEESNSQRDLKKRKRFLLLKEKRKTKPNSECDDEKSSSALQKETKSKVKKAVRAKKSFKEFEPGLKKFALKSASKRAKNTKDYEVRNDFFSIPKNDAPLRNHSTKNTVLFAEKTPGVPDLLDNQLLSSPPKKVKWQATERDVPSYVSFDDLPTPVRTHVSNRSDIQMVLQNLASHSSSLGNSCVLEDESDSRGTQALWTVASNSWVVAFSQRIELRGFVTVTSLTKLGVIDIHGHRLGHKDSVKIFAPPGYHHGVLENHFTDGEHEESLSKAELGAQLPFVAPRILQEIHTFCGEHKDCALLLFYQFESTQLQTCLDMLGPTKVMPGYISLRPRLLISDCYVAPRYTARTLQAIQHIAESHKPDSPLRVVVCGDKNLGKSTLIKFIINRLLSLCQDGVTHLECDPSQCEFSPSGCLTLQTVKDPLLGPPWTHIPDRVDNSQLYGALSADIDPEKYVRCMRKLVADYMSQDTSRPLIVNTMGWKQGLGLEFLAATIAEVKPSHVIQLSTDNSSYRNFDPFSVLTLASHDLYLPQHSRLKLLKDLDYELIQLAMPHYSRLDFDSEVLPPTLSRDLATTAYMFRSSLPNQKVINDILPYSINMSEIALDLSSDSLPSHLLSDAARMQMVILCEAKEQLIRARDDGGFQELPPSADLNVVGYGLVRAIDSTHQRVYITTPLSASELVRTNVLYKLHGTITPEFWFYQQLCQVKDAHGLPYLSYRKSGAGFTATADARYRFRKSNKN
ncbi:polynucleotide 5'-hydroxyl-kinase NOL9-like [Watersipora subatra]|uniref:polynucleotide 5'-hydroxyl-kinase NOL9-like n=1 Tax=Watersipora subatra TaxID=2589382 RepID=UPI00355B3E4E